MPLAHHRTFGRSGLVVSPLALGTMTFGTARWGVGDQAAREVFDTYVEAGGNFIDTADVYAGGRSEEMVGAFIADRAQRDRMVIATKSGFAPAPGGHAGGSGSGRIQRALEGSLRRMKTDYIDLYWLHVWDGVTPAEEVLQTMSGLVHAGKIRHWGLSNSPAWFVAKLATLAGAHGLPGPIGMQYFYSLANREVEDEHLPLAAEFGMALQPWSPLAYGLLTGKYDRATVEAGPARTGGVPRDAAIPGAERSDQDKRLDGDNPFGDTLFTDRNWRIVDEVKRIAAETGQSPARIALAWVVGRPGVVGTLMGVSRVPQVIDNAAALDLRLDPEHLIALDTVSAGDNRLIYGLARRPMRDHAVFGGRSVRGWTE